MFGIWLELGPLAELETQGCRQGLGLWDLLWDGTDVTGMGQGESEGIRVWVGVTGVRVGVWDGVEEQVRVV